MSIARCSGFALSLAGHIITHSSQPVQSSGATCTVYIGVRPRFSPATGSDPGALLKGTCLNVDGAASSDSGGYTFTRIAACGQTSAHLLHWMHSCSSQIGIEIAMLRFSHFAVPLGHVPSIGNALTGRRSP